MKKIIVILALALSAAGAMAQINTSSIGGELTRKGNNLFLDGRQLSSTEMSAVLGNDLYHQYRTGKIHKLVGGICVPVGCLAGGLGAGLIVDSNLGDDNLAFELTYGLFGKTIGYSFLIIGSAAVITGIVFLCSGGKKQSDVVVGYNNSHKYAMTLSPASSGFGLAFNF